MVIVKKGDPRVSRDHLFVDCEDRLRVHLHPRHLHGKQENNEMHVQEQKKAITQRSIFVMLVLWKQKS